MKLLNAQCHSVFGKGIHEERSRVKPVRLVTDSCGVAVLRGMIRSWLHDRYGISGCSAWLVPHGGIGFTWNGRRLSGSTRLAWPALPDVPHVSPIVNMRPTRFRVRLAYVQVFVHDFIHFH